MGACLGRVVLSYSRRGRFSSDGIGRKVGFRSSISASVMLSHAPGRGLRRYEVDKLYTVLINVSWQLIIEV